MRFPKHSTAFAVPLGRATAACSTLVVCSAAWGCAVPQPRGDGKLSRFVDPTTARGYWLYLPEAYVDSSDGSRPDNAWPVVVTFHGMKPFDNAHRQVLEWESEADRYGYIVVAPELHSVDLLGQFPVRRVDQAFESDETAALAILDHVFATTRADPEHVLATSWSSGGYMAHYMLNRHPDRFTCLSVRQSNFSEDVLDERATARSQHHAILIVNTENDFAICKQESRRALEWYRTHQYEHVDSLCLNGLGHQRTPAPTAAFFAAVVNSGEQRQRTPDAVRRVARRSPAPAGARTEAAARVVVPTLGVKQ